MLVLIAPRSARNLSLEELQKAADAGEVLVSQVERERLRDALLQADPGLIVQSESDEGITVAARGRSGMKMRLGPVWHEVELPDWHEGPAITWLTDRFVGLLRIFPRVGGGTVIEPEEGRPLDPSQQVALANSYRYRVQSGPRAPILPVLDVVASDLRAFAALAEPVLRQCNASAADRAWFYAEAATVGVDRDLPDAPVEVRYRPTDRRVEVVRYNDDGKATPVQARLASEPTPEPPDLSAHGHDDAAIQYLAELLTWA